MLKQMQQFTSRLLKKATKLRRIVAETIDAETDVTVMRSDRAAHDVAMATGSSDRRRHRKHGPRTSITDSITSRISRSIVTVLIIQSYICLNLLSFGASYFDCSFVCD